MVRGGKPWQKEMTAQTAAKTRKPKCPNQKVIGTVPKKVGWFRCLPVAMVLTDIRGYQPTAEAPGA